MNIGGTMGLVAGNVAYGGAPTRQDIGRTSGAITLSGTEDLGSGLKAGFVIQQGLYGWVTRGGAATTSLNTNSVQNFGDRQMFATLSGDFGTVKVGRDLNGASGPVLGVGNVSGVRAITGLDDNSVDAVYIGNVRSTSLSYTTPTVAGFTAYAGITPQNYSGLVAGTASSTITDGTNGIVAIATPGAASKKQDSPTAFGLIYSAGPFTAAIDMTNYQESFSALGTNGKTLTLAANYDLGIAKVGAIRQTAKGDAKADTKSTILTVNVPVTSQLSLGAAYGKRNATVNGSFSANETKHTQLGANYALSKRTVVFLTANKKNIAGATVNANDAKETGLGINHTF